MTVVGSRLGYDDDRDEQCVLWPVVVDGETVGGIKAKMKPTARTRVKYLNAPGPWVKTQALWPYDVVHQMLARQPRGKRTVVLVEGPRDALRLVGCGIPALAILGSNNWTTAKRDLLAQLDPDRVLFGMDSDAAGTKAFKLVAPTLKGYCVRKRMRYQEPGDPCSVSIDQIRRWIVAYKIPLAPLV
jgi:DNA primase